MNSTATLPDPAQARDYFAHKMDFTTGPVELERELAAVTVIDVRAEEDFRTGHIPGAINLPQARWGDHTVLTHDRTNVLCCYSQVCHLAAKAAVRFAEAGYPVKELEGGFEGWQKQGLPVETTADAAGGSAGEVPPWQDQR